jgi:SAM-dependent methyltransferase
MKRPMQKLSRSSENSPTPHRDPSVVSSRGGLGEGRSSRDKLRAWMHESLYDLPPASRILAVGCDEAFLAPQLAEYAVDVTVLDTAAADLAQLARRFPDLVFAPHKPSSRLPFPDNSFDAVWCGELLDRVFDPGAALVELRRVLVASGRLIVTVPDHGAVRHALATLLRRDEPASASIPRIHHFTRGALAKLTRQTGFEDVRTASDGPRAGLASPRRLLLRARKDSGAVVTPLSARARDQGGVDLMEDLAFASRTRAA